MGRDELKAGRDDNLQLDGWQLRGFDAIFEQLKLGLEYLDKYKYTELKSLLICILSIGVTPHKEIYTAVAMILFDFRGLDAHKSLRLQLLILN